MSSCATNDALDVWHSFTPSWSGEYTISLCGSTFDTTLTVFDQCDGIEIACNDDSTPGICDTYIKSHLTVLLQGNSSYLVRIAGFDGDMGDYNLIITGPQCTANISSDINLDCKVDYLDFAIIMSQWLTCNLEPAEACQ